MSLSVQSSLKTQFKVHYPVRAQIPKDNVTVSPIPLKTAASTENMIQTQSLCRTESLINLQQGGGGDSYAFPQIQKTEQSSVSRSFVHSKVCVN